MYHGKLCPSHGSSKLNVFCGTLYADAAYMAFTCKKTKMYNDNNYRQLSSSSRLTSFFTLQSCVRMETSDLLVVFDWTPGTGHWREGWSIAVERRGEQSVTTTLTTSMPGSSADKLDSQSVRNFSHSRLFLTIIIIIRWCSFFHWSYQPLWTSCFYCACKSRPGGMYWK